MALAKGSINPLNVIGQRKLLHIPPHFGVLNYANSQYAEKIDQWIYFNLNSRYCVRVKQGLDNQRKIIDICEIGIEDHRELTMLSLACPHLHNK